MQFQLKIGKHDGITASLAFGVALTLCFCAGCGENQSAQVADNVVAATADLVAIDPEIMQAQSILQQQCARSLGFDVPVDYTAIPASQGYADVGGIFRSEQEAMSKGYASETVKSEGRGFDENAYLETLSASERSRYEREVIGDVTDKGFEQSCAARSYAELFGSYERSGEVLNTFNEMVREQSASALDDKDVQRAITETYVPCMAQAGYQLQGLKAGKLAQERFGKYRKWNDPPNADEQAMAKQDYNCQRQAELMEHIDTAMERNAGAWMASNEGTLLSRHETLEAALGKANQVIAGQYRFEMTDTDVSADK